ncbi:MAG: hypothetical protein HUK15_07035, partial [Bacteroidales bacterium]|nr:hypothetical protein [Bacteroidales bacterium]
HLIPEEYAGQDIYVGLKATSNEYGGMTIWRFKFKKYLPSIQVERNLLHYESNIDNLPYTDNSIVTVQALTEDIHITTHEPYSVSVDDSEYSTDLTISHEDRRFDIYVKFDPAEGGEYVDSVILTSGNEYAKIKLIGNAISCEKTAPYIEPFNNGLSVYCWNSLSNDYCTFSFDAEATTYCLNDYTGSTDVWAVSPLLNFDETEPQRISFDHKISTTDSDLDMTCYLLNSNTEILDSVRIGQLRIEEGTSTSYSRFSVNVPEEFAGTAKYFAIHLYGPTNTVADIDNFKFENASPIIFTNTNRVELVNIIGEEADVKTISVTSEMLTEDISLTVDGDFEISTDGENFATTATISSESGIVYVRHITTDYDHQCSRNLRLSSSGYTAEVLLVGYNLYCSYYADYNMLFNNNQQDLKCWTIIDANHDNSSFEFINNKVYYTSSSESSDEWLISPALHIDENIAQTISFTTSNTLNYTYIYLLSSRTEIEDTLISLTVSSENADRYIIQIPEEFRGQTVYFAFRYNGPGVQELDNFKFTNSINVYPTNLSFETTVGNSEISSSQIMVDIFSDPSGEVMTQDQVLVTTSGFYSISLSEQGPFTSDLNITGNSTLYIKYTPTEAGEHEGFVSLNYNGISYIRLHGSATECTGDEITEFPFFEDFENGISNCWL